MSPSTDGTLDAYSGLFVGIVAAHTKFGLNLELTALQLIDQTVHFDHVFLGLGQECLELGAQLAVALLQRADHGGLADHAPSPSSGAGLLALHLSAARRTPAPSPDSALQKPPAKPTVLLLGGAQASAATEALLLVARELTLGKLRPLLARINVVLVPNTALAEAADPTVPDDHVQLNTASAQMLASLAHTQQATVVISVDEVPALTQLGTQTLLRAADVMVAGPRLQNLPEFLTRAGDQWFQQPMLAALRAEALRADGDSGGPAMAGEEKNAAHIANAAALKNRIGLQITTAGSDLGRAHVQRRVHAQVTAISSALVSTAKRTTELAELLPYLDREVAAQACRQPLAAVQPMQPAAQSMRWLDLSTGGEISVPPAAGNTMQKPASPESLRIKPCGYWLATASGQAVERLRLHGVRVMRVSEPTSLLGDTYNSDKSAASDKHASTRAGAPAQADRGQVTTSPYKLVRGLIDAPLGSYYVPVDQALGNVVVAALEPDGPSSLAASGLINVATGLARIMTPPTVKLGPFEPSTHSDKERP